MRCGHLTRKFPAVLETIGYDPEMAGWAAAGDTRLGRVVRVVDGVAGVLTEEGLVRVSFGARLLAAMAVDPAAAPCAGDWCVVRGWPDHRSTLEVVLPRGTAVVRGVAGEHRGQVVCANIDYAVVVVSAHPAPVPVTVRRLLRLARESGAPPLVVLTKADLVIDADQVTEEMTESAPGVDVICTSTVTGAGLATVRDWVAGRRTLALLGLPGHGKSSLTNALAGAQVLAARERRDDGNGRRTSARCELVILPDGGAVIDTPGLPPDESLAHTFATERRKAANKSAPRSGRAGR